MADLSRWRTLPDRLRRQPLIVGLAGGAALVGAVWLIAGRVDTVALRRALAVAADSPGRALLPLAAFGAAFALRAHLWCRVLPALPFGRALAAVHIGLAANHVLPLRLGEGVRALSATRWAGVPLRASVGSTVLLRTADMLALIGLGWLLGPAILHRHLGWVAWALPPLLAVALAIVLRWLVRQPEHHARSLRRPDAIVVAGTVGAWLLEAVLVWSAAHWVGIPLSPAGAVVVTAASVVSQIAGVAPGGIGTYEAAATAAYVALGHPAAEGLAAAVVAHGLTTAYSLVAGGAALALVRLSSRSAPLEPTLDLPVPSVAMAAVAVVEERRVEGGLV
ncbi:MAG: lysylphosphatidylglycerol synthase transmembrane domain-containing protein [Acidimicrobiia bacterium]